MKYSVLDVISPFLLNCNQILFLHNHSLIEWVVISSLFSPIKDLVLLSPDIKTEVVFLALLTQELIVG